MITRTDSRIDYTGNDVADAFSFDFKVFSDEDLVVTARDSAGVEETLVLDLDYTVTLVANGVGGGSVTLVAGALASGYSLTIRRVRALLQSTNFRNLGPFYPEAHESLGDHLIMVDQQQQDAIERSIRLPETEVGTVLKTVLPDVVTRALKAIGFDSLGNLTVLSSLADAVASAFGATVVGAASAPAAREVLGLGQGVVDVVFRNHGDFSGMAITGIPQFTWEAPEKLDDPADLPTGQTYSCAWSQNGEFLAVGHFGSPYLTIYQRSGASYKKLTNPSDLPAGDAKGCAWSPSGEFLAIAHLTTPFLTIYQRSGSTFTKLADPADLPVTAGISCAWSPNGEFLSVGCSGSPYIIIYQRSGTTFTKLANPADLPGSEVKGCTWSPNGEFLSVACLVSPYLIIYQRSGTTFTKLANPSSLPVNAVGCFWSPDGEFLALNLYSTPYMAVYQKSRSTFTKLTNPVTLPTGIAYACNWSPNGEFLAFAHVASPYVTVYQRSGTTFTKLDNPSELPAGVGSACAWSPNCEFLAIGHAGSPFVTIYQTTADMEDYNVLRLIKIPRAE